MAIQEIGRDKFPRYSDRYRALVGAVERQMMLRRSFNPENYQEEIDEISYHIERLLTHPHVQDEEFLALKKHYRKPSAQNDSALFTIGLGNRVTFAGIGEEEAMMSLYGKGLLRLSDEEVETARGCLFTLEEARTFLAE